MSSNQPPKPTALPTPSISGVANAFQTLLVGCLKVALELLAALFAITIGPLVVLAALVHWLWPWYSSVPPPRDLKDALITLSSVAGVLWSGSIIAYSIHKKYTPPLRTGVQLLNFAILAPLVGLIAVGAEMRTVFYFIGYFYGISTLFSLTNLEMLKPGKFTLKVPDKTASETQAAVELRQSLEKIRLKDIEFFKRVAHGTRYFALVSLLSSAIFITAKVSYIAWSCFIVIVVSLFLILPEIFRLDDGVQEKPLNAGQRSE
ncbi:MAG TPA: hypothetical protein VGG22_07795 [Candidatus Baltobacteraceae bacterium]